MTTEETLKQTGKQTLKKQITCGFELEKLEMAQKVHMNRTNSCIESDEFIIDSSNSKRTEPNHNSNHFGHCGNNVNLNENFNVTHFQLHRSDEYENLTEKGLLNEKEQDKFLDNNSHLKRTIEVENLINNEINNDD